MFELSQVSYDPKKNEWTAWQGENPIGDAPSYSEALALLKTS